MWAPTALAWRAATSAALGPLLAKGFGAPLGCDSSASSGTFASMTIERSSDSVTTMSGLMVESADDAQLFREVDSAGQPGDFDDAAQLDFSPQRPRWPV